MMLSSPAPGVWRAGDSHVNFYLVAEGSDLTLVDAGLPAHWDHLVAVLASLSRSLRDIRAVLVTHAHPDHSGLAERLRTVAGAHVWVHALDARILSTPPPISRVWQSARDLLPYVRYGPRALLGPLHLLRNGAFKARPVAAVTTFEHDHLLDVPGRPRAIHVPGHTPGSSAFVFEKHGLLFTGDALVTVDTAIGRVGPRVLCGAFTQNSHQALLSLDRLAALTDMPLVLPGHGEPWAVDWPRPRGWLGWPAPPERHALTIPGPVNPPPQECLLRRVRRELQRTLVRIAGFQGPAEVA